MRFVLIFLGVLLLGACAKVSGPSSLDFVNTSRFTSSNRTGLSPADTLASRIYAEDRTSGQPLGRLRITVRYMPRRNPFVYPTPLSALTRDSIDNNSEDFIYLDSVLTDAVHTSPTTFLLTSVFGVRTTTGSERWQYDLFDTTDGLVASRAIQLGMRRADSLYTYQDYTYKLILPAIGVPGAVRGVSTRRFLQLRAGLALPAYTVLQAGAPAAAQTAAQKLTDLIILPDGLTLASPNTPASSTFKLDATRWPAANRNATTIYLAGSITPTIFANQTTDASITAIFNQAAQNGGTGKITSQVTSDQVYAFKTAAGRYGLLLVVSVPTSTTTTQTAGLNLQIRMAK